MEYTIGDYNKIANCLVQEMSGYTEDMKHPECDQYTIEGLKLWRVSAGQTLYKTLYMRTLSWGQADKLFDEMTKHMLSVSERTDIIKSAMGWNK